MLLLVVALLLPSAICYAALHLVDVMRFIRRRLWPDPVVAFGRPVERIAADVRRLRAQVDAATASTAQPAKALRRRALLAAYDDVLVEACRALDVREDLRHTRGDLLFVERCRVELALRDAGLTGLPQR